MGVLGEPIPVGSGCESFDHSSQFLLCSTLNATQTAALSVIVDAKNRFESEQTLISNLYLHWGRKDRTKFAIENWGLSGYGGYTISKGLDAIEGEFKKERSEIYEFFQLLSRRQLIGESLEQFHAVFSGLAVRCPSAHWKPEF